HHAHLRCTHTNHVSSIYDLLKFIVSCQRVSSPFSFLNLSRVEDTHPFGAATSFDGASRTKLQHERHAPLPSPSLTYTRSSPLPSSPMSSTSLRHSSQKKEPDKVYSPLSSDIEHDPAPPLVRRRGEESLVVSMSAIATHQRLPGDDRPSSSLGHAHRSPFARALSAEVGQEAPAFPFQCLPGDGRRPSPHSLAHAFPIGSGHSLARSFPAGSGHRVLPATSKTLASYNTARLPGDDRPSPSSRHPHFSSSARSIPLPVSVQAPIPSTTFAALSDTQVSASATPIGGGHRLPGKDRSPSPSHSSLSAPRSAEHCSVRRTPPSAHGPVYHYLPDTRYACSTSTTSDLYSAVQFRPHLLNEAHGSRDIKHFERDIVHRRPKVNANAMFASRRQDEQPYRREQLHDGNLHLERVQEELAAAEAEKARELSTLEEKVLAYRHALPVPDSHEFLNAEEIESLLWYYKEQMRRCRVKLSDVQHRHVETEHALLDLEEQAKQCCGELADIQEQAGVEQTITHEKHNEYLVKRVKNTRALRSHERDKIRTICVAKTLLAAKEERKLFQTEQQQTQLRAAIEKQNENESLNGVAHSMATTVLESNAAKDTVLNPHRLTLFADDSTELLEPQNTVAKLEATDLIKHIENGKNAQEAAKGNTPPSGLPINNQRSTLFKRDKFYYLSAVVAMSLSCMRHGLLLHGDQLEAVRCQLGNHWEADKFTENNSPGIHNSWLQTDEMVLQRAHDENNPRLTNRHKEYDRRYEPFRKKREPWSACHFQFDRPPVSGHNPDPIVFPSALRPPDNSHLDATRDATFALEPDPGGDTDAALHPSSGSAHPPRLGTRFCPPTTHLRAHAPLPTNHASTVATNRSAADTAAMRYSIRVRVALKTRIKMEDCTQSCGGE
ncbi:hypothetical protein C8F01DRAFT_1330664, partial [Mycena amicta]